MNYKIRVHIDAKKELDDLDGSVRLIVLRQIKKLETKPLLGEALGNIGGLDLTGFRKMYADRKKIRIVYRIFEEEVEVFIIAINKREKSKVYEIATKRKKLE